MSRAKMMLAAIEPSADAMGADLFPVLKRKVPDADWFGCGGPLMAEQGFKTAFDTSAFSVMGFTDVARVLPEAWRRSRELAKVCETESVDVAVFIDGWSFSRMAAKRIRQRSPSTKIVKLAAPQVWASRPQRTEFVRDHFDQVLTLLPFEPEIFHAVGVDAHFVGNPNFARAAAAPRDPAAFRARHGLEDAPILVVLPGSRAGEVKRLISVFGEAVALAAPKLDGFRVVLPAAPAVKDLVREGTQDWPIRPLIIPPEERFDAFAAATAAVAASGTVSTELAMAGTPMTIAYRVDPLTAVWARKVLITDYVTIINVAASRFVIPERIQEQCTPEIIAQDIVRLMTDEEAQREQLSAFDSILPTLIGTGDPSEIAADHIASLLNGKDRFDLDSGT